MHHLLEIDSIIKNFGTRQLLTDVYLKINTGDVIGLFGRNGTGKSVLMQIIFGTMKSSAIAAKKAAEVSKLLGFLGKI